MTKKADPAPGHGHVRFESGPTQSHSRRLAWTRKSSASTAGARIWVQLWCGTPQSRRGTVHCTVRARSRRTPSPRACSGRSPSTLEQINATTPRRQRVRDEHRSGRNPPRNGRVNTKVQTGENPSAPSRAERDRQARSRNRLYPPGPTRQPPMIRATPRRICPWKIWTMPTITRITATIHNRELFMGFCFLSLSDDGR